jgi:hypothetical protein
MPIPCYPDFAPLGLELRNEIHPRLKLTTDGISEFTFSNLYLFRKRYQYRIARGPDEELIVSCTTPGDDTKFFMTPCGFPGFDILESLFKTHGYWKNIPSSLLEIPPPADGLPLRRRLEDWGGTISEDRDNFDYLYLRTELAALSGKKFHKKKNLVNAFMYAWPEHEERPLEPALIPDAQAVLEHWRRDKGGEGDYTAAKEALEVFSALELRGAIYYIGKRPAAYCLGEGVGRGTIFAIHFEKGIDQYKGVFQYMNQAFASGLPPDFIHINREQDLGDEGLRQAKMTYRPIGFVKKYRGAPHG